MRDVSCGETRVHLEFEIRPVSCRSCGTVKQETLSWLADNPFYTKRLRLLRGAALSGRDYSGCSSRTPPGLENGQGTGDRIHARATRRAGTPAPSVIGIDEISIGRWHSYRIIVSDLVRGRPIWFGGKDRSEASMDEFFAWLGPKKCRKIRLAVMDMWKAFRKSTLKEGHAPKARIIYDKFHVLKHLGAAMDKVRKQESRASRARTVASSRGRNTLCSPVGRTSPSRKTGAEAAVRGQPAAEQSLSPEGVVRPALGLQSAGLGSPVLQQLERCFEVATAGALLQVRATVEAHWDGIEAYCHEENKVPLGFVEGINNKVRVIQRRAYGLRDEEYLRLKILTCMLPEI